LILDPRAEVAVLKRNVRVSGTSEDNWGCRMLVTSYKDATTGTEYVGRLNMSNVEFFNCA
jgi:hypothetical protein